MSEFAFSALPSKRCSNSPRRLSRVSEFTFSALPSKRFSNSPSAVVDDRIRLVGAAVETLFELAEAVVDERMRLLGAAAKRCSNSPSRLSITDSHSGAHRNAVRTDRGDCR